MLDQPQIIQTDSRLTACIRLTIPREEIQEVMGPAIREVMAAVASQGLSPIGPVFSHHLRMDPGIFDFEVGVPVSNPVTAAGRVRAGELPAATVARTIYRGPYEGLGEAWGEFMVWIADQGLVVARDLWECYLTGPETGSDPTMWSTELNRPLVR